MCMTNKWHDLCIYNEYVKQTLLMLIPPPPSPPLKQSVINTSSKVVASEWFGVATAPWL